MEIIKDYVAPAKPVPFADEVRALAEAGDGAAIRVDTPAAELPKVITRFQRAARAEGYTGRVANTEESEDGAVSVWLKLAPKITRKAKDEGEASPEAEAANKRSK